jgi:rhodanese-related sulfurtransferase
MCYPVKLLLLAVVLLCHPALASEEPAAAGKPVMITSRLYGFSVTHKGKEIEVKRNQDRTNEIKEYFRPTWRSRIQPMKPFEPHDVETIAELEMLDYIRRLEDGDDSILIIDSRLPRSTQRGMIPLAVNIPYRVMKGENLEKLMGEAFDVVTSTPAWDFSAAKTLVMYCNGAWCGQSPAAIRRLLRASYPTEKIKYYRGGMQAWESFGLTVVDP